MALLSWCTKKTSTTTSSTNKTVLSSVANLIRLLPTGTVFLYQFLNPVFTNSGNCHTVNKYLSGILIGLCGFSCAFSSFTDSYTGSDGKTHYGIVTRTGLWPAPASKSVDLTAYKLRLGDFVHAVFAVLVFAVVVLLDTNTVACFYPAFLSTEKILMQVLPAAVGGISSVVFLLFPNTRHGIGYNQTSTDSSSKTSSQSTTT